MWIPPAHSPFRLVQVLRAVPAREGAVERFEAALGKWFAAESVRATGSGTEALQMGISVALDALAPDRRRIALPAFGCYDLVTAAVDSGALVAFYDVSPCHLGPVPASLGKAVETAGVVVVANLFGFPLDWRAVREITAGDGTVVIEDAAQGVGSEWEGGRGGSFGDLSVLSFGRGKGWTGGGGGALLLREPDSLGPALPRRERLARPPGNRLTLSAATAAQHLLGRPALYGLPKRLPWLGLGETIYHAPGPVRGIHPAMAELARRSRAEAEEAVEGRRAHARSLKDLLREAGFGELLPEPPEGGRASWLRFPFLLPPEARPPEGLARLGVVRSYPRPLPELWQEVAGEKAGLAPGGPEEFPGARRLAASLMTAPTHVHARARWSGTRARLRKSLAGLPVGGP